MDEHQACGTAYAAFGLAGPLALLGRRVPPGWTLYSLAALTPGVVETTPGVPLLSFPRFVLCAFPLFLALAWPLARSRIALAACIVVSGGLGLFLTALFTTGRWVA